MNLRQKAQIAIEKYKELYDFAPSGYFSLSKDGNILDLNLRAAKMIDKKRPLSKNIRFALFVSEDTRETFNSFLDNAFISGAELTCEVILSTPGNIPIYVHLNGMVKENQCLVSMVDMTERKLAKMLHDLNLRLGNIIEGTQAGTWEWNVQTGETIFNEIWAQIIGYTLEELAPLNIKTWETLTHPDDLKLSYEQLEMHFDGTLPNYNYDCRMKHKDGHWVWVHDCGQIMSWTSDGKPLMMFGTHTDITDRKQFEELLMQTRRNYEAFYNNIDYFLFVLDLRGNILHMNKTVIERLGYSREELLGQSILMVHPADRREEAGRIVTEMLDGTVSFCPVPIATKSGVQIPVETRVFQGIWDDGPVLFGVTKDISKITLSEEKFSKIFRFNPSACGLSGLDDHKYIEVNDAFSALLGFDKDEVIGKTATDLGILTPETIRDVLLKADGNGNVTNIGASLKARNGDIKHVLLSAENIYIQDKKYRFTFAQDITERKRVEDALIESEAKYKNLLWQIVKQKPL
ncbi:MAG: PAS domain-containing protein [Mariniphaga sp.]